MCVKVIRWSINRKEEKLSLRLKSFSPIGSRVLKQSFSDLFSPLFFLYLVLAVKLFESLPNRVILRSITALTEML